MRGPRPILRVEPRDEADFLWFWGEAEGELKGIGSLHSSIEARLLADGTRRHPPARVRTARLGGTTVDVGYRCGPIYVGAGAHHAQACEMDPLAVAAASRERRIRERLRQAGPAAEFVLRLRYREVLQACRIPFGLDGVGPHVRRGRPMRGAIGIRLNALRGCGSLAHLTESARVAYADHRTTLAIERWIDRLGNRLANGGATPDERTLQRAIQREAEAMVLAAYARYRRAPGRLPERVRRAGWAAGIPWS